MSAPGICTRGAAGNLTEASGVQVVRMRPGRRAPEHAH
jgi:hypothetical protein